MEATLHNSGGSDHRSPGRLRKLLRLSVTPRLAWPNILACAMLLFISWLGVIIMLGPATMGYDTYAQVTMGELQRLPVTPWDPEELWVEARYSDHHPLFDTLLFGFFAHVSKGLTGSWSAGFMTYVLLQAVAMALTFSLTSAYGERLDVALGFRRVCLAFYCLMPVFAVNAATMIKDTLFSWIFTLWFIVFLEAVVSRGKCLSHKLVCPAFIMLSLLVVLTKKTGIYIALVSLFFLCLFVGNGRRWIVCAMGSCALVMWIVLPLVVFPALDVIPGERQEALGTLFQQTARYVLDHGDEVTKDEEAAIDKVLDYDALPEIYDEDFEDPVKYTYKWSTVTPDDLTDYLAVWLAQGIKHPETYFDAWWKVVAPLFDPSVPMNLYLGIHKSLNEPGRSPQFEMFAERRANYSALCNSLTSPPLIGVLFSNLPYVVMPWVALVVLLIRRRLNASSLTILVPALLTFAFVMISPAPWSRYLYPLVYITPLLLYVSFGQMESGGHRKRGKHLQ